MLCNPYVQWLRQHTGIAQGVPLPSAVDMRQQRRGGMLDKHYGEIGLAVVMAPGDQPKTLLQLSADNKAEPRIVTVCFWGGETAPNAGDESNHRIQARLIFGTGKGFNEAFVDIKHGTQVSLPANIVQASVHYFGNNEGPTFRVSAAAANGSRPGTDSAPTYTEEEVALADAAQSVAFRVPSFAARVQWQSGTDPAVTTPVPTIRMFTGPTPGDRIISQLRPAVAQWVALPEGADFIRIRNDSGDLARFTLIYELEL